MGKYGQLNSMGYHFVSTLFPVSVADLIPLLQSIPNTFRRRFAIETSQSCLYLKIHHYTYVEHVLQNCKIVNRPTVSTLSFKVVCSFRLPLRELFYDFLVDWEVGTYKANKTLRLVSSGKRNLKNILV